ncbi:nitrite reductase small subunit NirD [Halioxenophilus aromaticivorans]|uniref:Nitrite reductase small subunit NirD n=1 Tax=Halioxenophilus aromaticivorans TaxID=1306992 RepID=A0AAV3U974_9ALTE
MSSWIKVCQLSDIAPNTGVCALVNGQQVAIFREAKSDAVFAIGNYDPIGKANVLSRGLMAQLGDNITVASPLYKQHYRLTDGQCLEQDGVNVPVYEVRITDGAIEIAA